MKDTHAEILREKEQPPLLPWGYLSLLRSGKGTLMTEEVLIVGASELTFALISFRISQSNLSMSPFPQDTLFPLCTSTSQIC